MNFKSTLYTRTIFFNDIKQLRVVFHKRLGTHRAEMYYSVLQCKRETYLFFSITIYHKELPNLNSHHGGREMKPLLNYNLDLIKLEGNGDFACPCCGTLISPDDQTEAVYSVLEAKVRENILENLIIRCNICREKIVLTGFSLLEQ